MIVLLLLLLLLLLVLLLLLMLLMLLMFTSLIMFMVIYDDVHDDDDDGCWSSWKPPANPLGQFTPVPSCRPVVSCARPSCAGQNWRPEREHKHTSGLVSMQLTS